MLIRAKETLKNEVEIAKILSFPVTFGVLLVLYVCNLKYLYL